MNILKIIQFIGDKNPKYNWGDLELPTKPVDGKGYMDDNGLKQGEWEHYDDNGELRSKGTYKDGKRNGYWETYYYNGKLESKGTYKDDEKDGIWEEYWEGGELGWEETYMDGVRID